MHQEKKDLSFALSLSAKNGRVRGSRTHRLVCSIFVELMRASKYVSLSIENSHEILLIIKRVDSSGRMSMPSLSGIGQLSVFSYLIFPVGHELRHLDIINRTCCLSISNLNEVEGVRRRSI